MFQLFREACHFLLLLQKFHPMLFCQSLQLMQQSFSLFIYFYHQCKYGNFNILFHLLLILIHFKNSVMDLFPCIFYVLSLLHQFGD